MFIKMWRYKQPTKEEIENMDIETTLDLERAWAEKAIEEKLQQATYPRFGYMTAQVFENAEEYEKFMREVLEEEIDELKEYMTPEPTPKHTRNAPTTKISAVDHEEMLYVEIGNVTLYAKSIDGYEVEDGYRSDYYVITSHDGEMPAFHTSEFDTLQELANEMRKIADLRTWKFVKYDD